ncbi:MAG: DUF5671 domain-containing protein [Candidatus Paceibacterota bacterium]
MTILILVALIIPVLVALGIGSVIYLLIKKNNNSMETKTKAIDVFVYLGIFISLIVSVTNIIQILFTAIERKFTDVLEAGMYVDMYGSDMRLAIASLVVMFPIYLLLSMYVSRDIKKFLYKRDLPIRKIFVYTTLFVTACTLLGSLVATIYYYLGGELTVRFGLKALTVFVIAGAVCGYYLYALRRDYTKETTLPNIIAGLSALFVVASLTWSISIIGTPGEMRMKRIDDARLSDISRIQQEIFNHFQTTDKLPLALSDLDDAFQGYSVPKDPVTGETYIYRVLQQPVVRNNVQLNRKELVTPAMFELCATFDTERKYDERGSPIFTEKMYAASNYYYSGDTSAFWNHGVGETCFKRVISSDMYYGR